MIRVLIDYFCKDRFSIAFMNIERPSIIYAPIFGSRDHQVEELALEELREELFNSPSYILPCSYIDFRNTYDDRTNRIFRRIMMSPGEYINLIPCCCYMDNDNTRWSWFNLNSLLYTYDSGAPIYPIYYNITNIQERVKLLLEEDHFVPVRIRINMGEDSYMEELQNKAEELKYSIDNLVISPFSLSESLPCLNTLGKRAIFPHSGQLGTIRIGISFLRLLLTYEQNPNGFNRLYNIKKRMPVADFLKGLVLGKSTIGIYYNREDYTFIVETNMGDLSIKSVIDWLRNDLFTEMRCLKSTLPEDRFPREFQSIIYEAYFRDYK